jgi:hypothetical protein
MDAAEGGPAAPVPAVASSSSTLSTRNLAAASGSSGAAAAAASPFLLSNEVAREREAMDEDGDESGDVEPETDKIGPVGIASVVVEECTPTLTVVAEGEEGAELEPDPVADAGAPGTLKW